MFVGLSVPSTQKPGSSSAPAGATAGTAPQPLSWQFAGLNGPPAAHAPVPAAPAAGLAGWPPQGLRLQPGQGQAVLLQAKNSKPPATPANQHPPVSAGGRQLQYDPGGAFPGATPHRHHAHQTRPRHGVVDGEEAWNRTYHQDYLDAHQAGPLAASSDSRPSHGSGKRADDNKTAAFAVSRRTPASSSGSEDCSDEDDDEGSGVGEGKFAAEDARGAGHRWGQGKGDGYDQEYDWPGAPHEHDSDASEGEAAAEREYRHKHASAGTMPVDLRLAQTYVPAFMCLLRCSALIIVISRPWACYSLPVHACLGAVIYIDRVARSEVILDSNALMGTLLVAHTVNAFRCAPDQHTLYLTTKVRVSQQRQQQQQEMVHQKQLAVAAILHQERNSSTTALHDWAQGASVLQASEGSPVHVYAASFVGEVAQAAYIVNSLLLVWGLDMSAAGAALLLTVGTSCALLFGGSAAEPRTRGPRHRGHATRRPISSSPAGHHQHLLSSSYGGSVCRVCTVLFSGLLLVGFTQTPVDRLVGMAPVSIMSRSFMFLCLCLVWSYTAGVHDMVQLLQGSPRGPVLVSLTVPQPNGKARACRVQATVAQSFIPCQLRFTCVLFLHGSTLYIVAGCMTVLLLHYVLKIKNATAMTLHKQGDVGKQGPGPEGGEPDGEQPQSGERFAAAEGPALRIRKTLQQNSRKHHQQQMLLRNKDQYHQHNIVGGRVHSAPGSLTELEELSSWSLENMVHPDYRIPSGSPAGGEADACSGGSVAKAMLGHSEIPGVFINATTDGALTGSTPYRVFPAASPVTLASAWTHRTQESQAGTTKEGATSITRPGGPSAHKPAAAERLNQAAPGGHQHRNYEMDPSSPPSGSATTRSSTPPPVQGVLGEDAPHKGDPSAPPLPPPFDPKDQPTPTRWPVPPTVLGDEDPSKLPVLAATAALSEAGEGKQGLEAFNEGLAVNEVAQSLLSKDDPDLAPSLFAGLNISALQEAGSLASDAKGGEEDFNSTLKLFMQAMEASQQQQQLPVAADVQRAGTGEDEGN